MYMAMTADRDVMVYAVGLRRTFGDVVRFLTRPVRVGRTSITMKVRVEADRGQDVLHVTEAEVVYVGVDPISPERRPVSGFFTKRRRLNTSWPR